MEGKNRMLLCDLTAPENEREWSVELGLGGGLVVRTYDDAHGERDSITLKRYGGFLVLDLAPHVDVLPESLEFLRPAIEAHKRMRSVGLDAFAFPLLVHSTRIRRALELGRAQRLSAYTPRGSLLIHGLKVVWDEALDRHATPS